jgi:hypothetical protein
MGNIRTLCRSTIAIVVWNGFSALATVYHSDGSAASVQGLHDAALNGDTITLPAGRLFGTDKSQSLNLSLCKAQASARLISGRLIREHRP